MFQQHTDQPAWDSKRNVRQCSGSIIGRVWSPDSHMTRYFQINVHLIHNCLWPSTFLRLHLVVRLSKVGEYRSIDASRWPEALPFLLIMLGGEAIKNISGETIKIDAWKQPVARLSKVREYWSMLEDDQWQGYQTRCLKMTGPSPFCQSHVHLVGRPSKVGEYRLMLVDNQWWGY